MTIIRDVTTYRTLQANLAKDTTILNDLYIKTSTGCAVAKSSDDPSSVQTIIGCRSEITQTEKFIANCADAQDSLTNSETYVDSVLEVMDRAREIATAAANTSLSASDLATYADEVSRLQDSLLDLANTKVDGKYIFAGYDDTSQPFSGTPVTYNGTTDQIMIEVTAGTSIARNITGDELFTSPIDLFATLDNLAAALQSGDAAVISSQIDTVEDASEQVRTVQSQLGNNAARIDDINAMQASALLLLQDRLSTAQDADLSAVLSEISKMELSLEATMQVASRVTSLNLFDYL